MFAYYPLEAKPTTKIVQTERRTKRIYSFFYPEVPPILAARQR